MSEPLTEQRQLAFGLDDLLPTVGTRLARVLDDLEPGQDLAHLGFRSDQRPVDRYRLAPPGDLVVAGPCRGESRRGEFVGA